MTNPTPPDDTRTEETILEISKLQDEIQVRARRIHELASLLYRRVRRAPADDSTPIYMVYANAFTRFAGAVDHVGARTVRTARVLDRLPKAPEPKKTEPKPKVTPAVSDPSPMESLMSLYVSEPEDVAPKSAT